MKRKKVKKFLFENGACTTEQLSSMLNATRSIAYSVSNNQMASILAAEPDIYRVCYIKGPHKGCVWDLKPEVRKTVLKQTLSDMEKEIRKLKEVLRDARIEMGRAKGTLENIRRSKRRKHERILKPLGRPSKNGIKKKLDAMTQISIDEITILELISKSDKPLSTQEILPHLKVCRTTALKRLRELESRELIKSQTVVVPTRGRKLVWRTEHKIPKGAMAINNEDLMVASECPRNGTKHGTT